MPPVKVRPVSNIESSQNPDDGPPAKRQKASSKKDTRHASGPQKTSPFKLKNEKGPININAAVGSIPYESYVNKKALDLFREVTVFAS